MIFSGTHVLYKSTCGCNDIKAPTASHTLQTHACVHICAVIHAHTPGAVNILATCAQYLCACACLLSFIYKAPYTEKEQSDLVCITQIAGIVHLNVAHGVTWDKYSLFPPCLHYSKYFCRLIYRCTNILLK